MAKPLQYGGLGTLTSNQQQPTPEDEGRQARPDVAGAAAIDPAAEAMRTLQAVHPRLQRFTLDDATRDTLTGMAPREMRKRIRLACGQAAQAERLVAFPSALPADARQGRRTGF